MEAADSGASERRASAELEQEAKQMGPPGEAADEVESVGLLDLSDDVLLCVLQYCTPRDLKALGFACPRLGRLVVDRSLWCRVDARAHATGREQLRWYLQHTLGAHTTKLALSGFADESRGCLGTVECPRPSILKNATSNKAGVQPYSLTPNFPPLLRRGRFFVPMAADQPPASNDAAIPPDGPAEGRIDAPREPPRPHRPKAPVQGFNSAQPNADCRPADMVFSTNAPTSSGEGLTKTDAKKELGQAQDKSLDKKVDNPKYPSLDAAKANATTTTTPSVQDFNGYPENASLELGCVNGPSASQVLEPTELPAKSSRNLEKVTTDTRPDETTTDAQGPSRPPANPVLHSSPNLREMLSTNAPTLSGKEASWGPPNFAMEQNNSSAETPTSSSDVSNSIPVNALQQPSPNLRRMLSSTNSSASALDQAISDNPTPSFIASERPPATALLHPSPNLRRMLASRNTETASAQDGNGVALPDRDRNDNIPEPAQDASGAPERVVEGDLRRLLFSGKENAEGQGANGVPDGPGPSNRDRNGNIAEPVEGPSAEPARVLENDLLRRMLFSNNAAAEGQVGNGAPANGPMPAADAQDVPDWFRRGPNEADFPCRRPCLYSRQRSHYRQLPRFSGGPAWRVEGAAEGAAEAAAAGEVACAGPRWTLARTSLAELRVTCPALAELHLERCNIDCNITQISDFPKTLRVLSLRGSRCFNLEVNKSYLFRIQDFMPNLEEVDVSECHWMEPATLLPLSKLPELRVLRAERCLRLTECVAYASLASRYGFRKLKVLELRGTPMGDSEVSGLGWLPELEELYLEPADVGDAPPHHSHYLDDAYATRAELEPWEREEPEYFRTEPTPAEIGNSEMEDCYHEIEEADREIATNFNVQGPGVQRSPAFLNWFEEIRREQGAEQAREEPRGEVDPDEPPAKRARMSTDNLPKKPTEEPSTSKEVKIKNTHNPNSSSPNTSALDSPSGTKSPPLASDDDSPSTSVCFKRRVVMNGEPLLSKRSKSDSSSPATESPPNSPPSPLGSPDEQRKQEDARPAEAPRRRPSCDGALQEQRVRLARALDDGVRERAEATLRRDRERRMRRERDQNRIDEMDDYFGQGRVHVIYVNVRRPRNEVFRMLIQDEQPQAAEGADARADGDLNRAIVNVVELPPNRNADAEPDDEGANALRNGPNFAIMPEFNRLGVNNRGQVMNILRMPFIQNFLYGPATGPGHLGGPSLITDAAINRFGHSEGPDTVNYVHIGPNGAFRAGVPPANGSDRPNKSRLRVLVCRGFSGVTVRSLNHLVTAAPALRHLDVTGTKVTERDVVAFKNLRPECDVKYTPTKE